MNNIDKKIEELYKQSKIARINIADSIQQDFVSVDELRQALLDIQKETAKAYGGCEKCYGKGYSTVEQIARTRRSAWKLNPMHFCECDRGKQLKQLTGEDYQ